MIEKLIDILSHSRFREFSKLFFFANKQAYVSLRVYQSYSESGDGFESFKDSAKKNTLDYIDKSIRTIEAVKKEALTVSNRVLTARALTADFNPSSERNEILKSAQHFVRIEKAWDSIEDLVVEMKINLESGDEGRADVAKKDAMDFLKVVVINADRAISVLQGIKQRMR